MWYLSSDIIIKYMVVVESTHKKNFFEIFFDFLLTVDTIGFLMVESLGNGLFYEN